MEQHENKDEVVITSSVCVADADSLRQMDRTSDRSILPKLADTLTDSRQTDRARKRARERERQRDRVRTSAWAGVTPLSLALQA